MYTLAHTFQWHRADRKQHLGILEKGDIHGEKTREGSGERIMCHGNNQDKQGL